MRISYHGDNKTLTGDITFVDFNPERNTIKICATDYEGNPFIFDKEDFTDHSNSFLSTLYEYIVHGLDEEWAVIELYRNMSLEKIKTCEGHTAWNIQHPAGTDYNRPVGNELLDKALELAHMYLKDINDADIYTEREALYLEGAEHYIQLMIDGIKDIKNNFN